MHTLVNPDSKPDALFYAFNHNKYLTGSQKGNRPARLSRLDQLILPTPPLPEQNRAQQTCAHRQARLECEWLSTEQFHIHLRRTIRTSAIVCAAASALSAKSNYLWSGLQRRKKDVKKKVKKAKNIGTVCQKKCLTGHVRICRGRVIHAYAKNQKASWSVCWFCNPMYMGRVFSGCCLSVCVLCIQ